MENDRSGEQPAVTERASIMAAYILSALVNVHGVEFSSDLEQGIYIVNHDKHWYDGRPITAADRQNLASASVLKQIRKAFNNPGPFVLGCEVYNALDVYMNAQQVLDAVRFDEITQNANKEQVRSVTRNLTGAETSGAPAVRAVTELWNRRGNVDVPMIKVADIVEAMEQTDYSMQVPDDIHIEGGLISESYRFPETPAEVQNKPFYLSMFSHEDCQAWLNALLEDLTQLDLVLSGTNL